MGILGTIGTVGGILGKQVLQNMFPTTYGNINKLREAYTKPKDKNDKKSGGFKGLNEGIVQTNALLAQSIEVQKIQNDLLEEILHAMQGIKKNGGMGFNFDDLFEEKTKPKEEAKPKEEVAREKIYENVEEAKKAGGGKYRDSKGRIQEILKNEETGHWGNKPVPKADAVRLTAPKTVAPVAEESVMSKIWSGTKSAAKRVGGVLNEVGEVGVKIAGKVAMPVLCAYACWELYEKISAMDPTDPDYKKNITKAVADLIARFGLVTVSTMLGTIAAGVVSGPGAIVGFIAGLGAGVAADYMLGDTTEELVNALIDKIWPSGTAPASKPNVVPGDGKQDASAGVVQKDGSRLIQSPIIDFNAKDILFTAKDMLIRYNDIKQNDNSLVQLSSNVGDDRPPNNADTGYRADPSDRRPENVPDQLAPVTPIPGESQERLAARIKAVNPYRSNQECVALAKASVGSNASVTSWRRGANAVQNQLPVGTPVATFMNRQGKASERYDAGGTGSRGTQTTHAAVVAGYEKDKQGVVTGMQVWEQYAGSGGPRLKTYPVDSKKFGEKNASNYFAIEQEGKNGERIALGGTNNPNQEYLEKQQQAAKQPTTAPVAPPVSPTPEAPLKQAASALTPPAAPKTKYKSERASTSQTTVQSLPSRPQPMSSNDYEGKASQISAMLGVPSNILLGAYLTSAA